MKIYSCSPIACSLYDGRVHSINLVYINICACFKVIKRIRHFANCNIYEDEWRRVSWTWTCIFLLSPTDARYTIAGVPYMYIYIHVANTLHNIVMIVYFSNLCQPTRDITIIQSLEQRRNLQLLKLMYQQSKNIGNIKPVVRPTRAAEKIVFNVPTKCTTKYLSSPYYLGTHI